MIRPSNAAFSSCVMLPRLMALSASCTEYDLPFSAFSSAVSFSTVGRPLLACAQAMPEPIMPATSAADVLARHGWPAGRTLPALMACMPKKKGVMAALASLVAISEVSPRLSARSAASKPMRIELTARSRIFSGAGISPRVLFTSIIGASMAIWRMLGATAPSAVDGGDDRHLQFFQLAVGSLVALDHREGRLVCPLDLEQIIQVAAGEEGLLCRGEDHALEVPLGVQLLDHTAHGRQIGGAHRVGALALHVHRDRDDAVRVLLVLEIAHHHDSLRRVR